MRTVDRERAIVRALDNEIKRRKRNQQLYHEGLDDLIKAPSRQAGTQDLTDISTETCWQKELYDRAGGVLYEYGKMLPCPKCGYKYMAGFWPDRCIMCGCESPLSNKRFINFKR